MNAKTVMARARRGGALFWAGLRAFVDGVAAVSGAILCRVGLHDYCWTHPAGTWICGRCGRGGGAL